MTDSTGVAATDLETDLAASEVVHAATITGAPTEEGTGSVTPLNQLRVLSQSAVKDSASITGWQFTGPSLPTGRWMSTNDASIPSTTMSELATYYDMHEGQVPTDIRIGSNGMGTCAFMVEAPKNFRFFFTTDTGSTHVLDSHSATPGLEVMTFPCYYARSITQITLRAR